MTWHRAYGVSSGLTPNLLIPSGGAVRPASPVRGQESGQQQEQPPRPSQAVPGPSSPVATPNAGSPPASPTSELSQATPQATAAPAVPLLEASQAGLQPQLMALPAAREQEPSLQAELPVLQQQSEATSGETFGSGREPAESLAEQGLDARTSSPKAGQSKHPAVRLSLKCRSE